MERGWQAGRKAELTDWNFGPVTGKGLEKVGTGRTDELDRDPERTSCLRRSSLREACQEGQSG